MYVTVFKITLTLYLLGTVVYLLFLVFSRPMFAWVGRYILGIGFLSHCLILFTRYVQAGHTPVVNLHESLSFFSWTVVGFFLLLRYRYKVDVLGAVVTPLAALLFIWAAALPKEIFPLHPTLKSYWLPVHVTLAFLGNAIFAIAFCTGVIISCKNIL